MAAKISLSTGTPDFIERHSLGIRIWHWTFFLLMIVSLVTVLLASTIFRTRNTIALVREELQQKNLTVNQDQARAVAHAFNDILWNLHTWNGYIICIFLLGRVVLELTQPGDEKLSRKLRKTMGFEALSPVQKAERRHYVRVKWGYLIFYALILIMAVTGLGLAFEDVPFFRAVHRSIKQVHSFTQYLIYGFILLHLGGVILADTGRYPGLVSGMIHGKKGANAAADL